MPLLMLAIAIAAACGVFVSQRFESIAYGWIASVAAFALFGAAIDHCFSGVAVLERQIRHRPRAPSRTRRHAFTARSQVAMAALERVNNTGMDFDVGVPAPSAIDDNGTSGLVSG